MDSLLNENLNDFVSATSKEIIERKLLNFHKKLNRVATFLRDHNAPADIQINAEEIYLECYVDKPAIARLMTIAMQDNFAQFGVFFGLEKPRTHDEQASESTSFGRLTTCFLGLDANQNILGCHFPKGSADEDAGQVIDGEDTWPPPPIDKAAIGTVADLPYDPEKAFTLFSDVDFIKNYFELKPGPKPPTS